MEENYPPPPSPQVPSENPHGIVLLHDAQAYLVSAGKWAIFLGILGFIATGLVAIMALFAGTMMSTMSTYAPAGPFRAFGAAAGIMVFFYLLIAVFNFFLSLYLYQFGTKIREGIALQSSLEVTASLGKLKSMFKLVGIMAIVIMILYAIIIFGAIIFASRMSHI